MDKPTSKSTAHFLSEARSQHRRLKELPSDARPQNAEDAYDCQAAVVARLIEDYGGTAIGYKIACTSEVAQRQLRVDTPFSGRLLSSFCYESGQAVKTEKFFMRIIEAEFAFQVGRDLPPTGATRGREEIADSVLGVLPGIEIVDSRFDSWTTVGTPSLIADNACHAAWVKGKLLTDWKGMDLARQAVRLEINGELKGTGNGAAVLGHPLNALQWLVNALNARGMGLRAGDYVTTGVTTDIYMAERGDRIRADFGSVGAVEVAFD